MTEDHKQEEDVSTLWDKLPRGPLIVLVIVGAVLIIVVGAWAFVKPTDPTEKKDFLQAVGVLLAGLIGLGGLYFTWRNLNQTRQITQRTLELTERGQITERFTRAIDQLGATDDAGNKRMEIRLGGIYALERIARDSELDHWPIMEVLSAYVRQHAPWPPEDPSEREHVFEIADTITAPGDLSGTPEITEDLSPAPDIQAIMTVLRRRTRSFGRGEPEPLDLHETNLLGANLSGANLSGVNLSGAHLWKANLSGTNLSGANLSRTYLWEANLLRADLSGTNLSGANLLRADLWKANLSGANLSEANLSGTHLWKANFGGTRLWRVNLSGASISASARNREEAEEAYSEGHFSEWEESPTQVQLEEADGDEHTQLPFDLKPPAHWSVKTDEQTEGE